MSKGHILASWFVHLRLLAHIRLKFLKKAGLCDFGKPKSNFLHTT